MEGSSDDITEANSIISPNNNNNEDKENHDIITNNNDNNSNNNNNSDNNDDDDNDRNMAVKSVKSNYYKVTSIKGHTNTVSSVKFSPNGSFFASGCKKITCQTIITLYIFNNNY